MWDTTNNTVGFNHMVASAPDAAAGRPAGEAASRKAQRMREQCRFRRDVSPSTRCLHPQRSALAMETMFNYTAYFQDGDKRYDEQLPSSPCMWRSPFL